MNTKILKRSFVDFDETQIKNLSIKFGLQEKLVELLFARGINSEDKISRFLYPDVKNLYDPFLMKGMRGAVARIREAIEQNERILIYGDYDADGVCASAILALYFKSIGVDVCVHIPDRVKDGYGLSNTSIENVIEEVNPDLILTCDCGISGVEEVQYCQELGVDIIVTDHHEPGDIIPDCVVVNPKIDGDEYPDKFLCGAGVALKVVQALSENNEYLEYFDIVAIATIADLVPLLDENRLLVQLGIKALSSGNCNVGLKRLLLSQDINIPTSSDITYKIAPRINAAGRIGDAYRAFELIVSDDVELIDKIIREIENDNDTRKQVCDKIYSEAVVDLSYEDIVNNRAIILSNPEWMKGVTGIAAARLSGDYNRPTFIIVGKNSDGLYKGTARGILGINVFEALKYASEFLEEFGGHEGAAGFSIYEKNLDAFKKKLNEYFDNLSKEYFVPSAYFDVELSSSECTVDLLNSLKLLEPTGNCFSKPLFKICANNVAIAPCKNPQHSSVMIGGLQTYAFNYYYKNQFFMGCEKKDIIVELSEGLNGGVSGYVKNIGINSLYINDEVTMVSYMQNINLKGKSAPKYTEYENVVDLLPNNIYGTLFVCADRNSYTRICSYVCENFVMHEFMYKTEKNNYSGIIVAPNFGTFSLANYEKIVFVDAVPSFDVVSYLNDNTSAQIFIPKTDDNLFDGVSGDRQVFAKYYSYITKNADLYVGDVVTFYKRIASKYSDISALQFIICWSVFVDLQFITLDGRNIKVNSSEKKELSVSRIYKLI